MEASTTTPAPQEVAGEAAAAAKRKEPVSYAKRDFLIAIEKEIAKDWEEKQLSHLKKQVFAQTATPFPMTQAHHSSPAAYA